MFIHLFSPYRGSIDRRAKGATYGVAAVSHTGARGCIVRRAKGATYGVVAVSHTGARRGIDCRAKGATYRSMMPCSMYTTMPALPPMWKLE